MFRMNHVLLLQLKLYKNFDWTWFVLRNEPKAIFFKTKTTLPFGGLPPSISRLSFGDLHMTSGNISKQRCMPITLSDWNVSQSSLIESYFNCMLWYHYSQTWKQNVCHIQIPRLILNSLGKRNGNWS